VILRQPGVLVPAEVCGPIAQVLEREFDRLRRQGVTIHSGAETLVRELRAFATAGVTAEGLPLFDEPTADPGSWTAMTTSEASEVLGTRERNIVDLISRGQLVAVKIGNSYRIDARSVQARAEKTGRA